MPMKAKRILDFGFLQNQTKSTNMIGKLAVLLLPSLATASSPLQTPELFSFCGLIAPYLPSECSCSEKQLGASFGCAVDFLGKDTIGVYATLDVCDVPATADIIVNDTKFHVTKELAGLHAGKRIDYPIPGVSIDIPDVGSAGVDLVFDVEGDASDLDVKIGLDACGKVFGKQICGSKLYHKLPIWIIDHTFNFDSVCKSRQNTTTLKQANVDHPCKTDADCADICSYCMNGDGKQPPFVCHAPQSGCCTSDDDCAGSYCMNGPQKTPPYHCHGSYLN